MADLIKEYMPSMSTKKFQDCENPQEKVITTFLTKTTEATKAAREKYQVRRDVRYGGDADNQLMDIYFKDNEENKPIFVFIHGGYWQELTKETSGSFVGPLVENGFCVITIDYNLCPSVTLEELVNQTENFFDWLFEYANKNQASKIGICGHSAGAHLAATLLNERLLNKYKNIKQSLSLILISGVYDLRVLANLECVNPNNILGLDDEKAIILSPQLWSFSEELVCLMKTMNLHISLLVGEDESQTFIDQSRNFFNKIQVIENSEFKIFENYDHFNIIENAADVKSDITSFVLKNLKKVDE